MLGVRRAPGRTGTRIGRRRLVRERPQAVLTRLRLLNPPGRGQGRRTKSPPYRTIAAVLAADSYNLTLEEIGRLTPSPDQRGIVPQNVTRMESIALPARSASPTPATRQG